jgi:hypothetical protein
VGFNEFCVVFREDLGADCCFIFLLGCCVGDEGWDNLVSVPMEGREPTIVSGA